MWPNPQETAELVTFTEESHNGKLQFLCSDCGDSDVLSLLFAWPLVVQFLHFLSVCVYKPRVCILLLQLDEHNFGYSTQHNRPTNLQSTLYFFNSMFIGTLEITNPKSLLHVCLFVNLYVHPSPLNFVTVYNNQFQTPSYSYVTNLGYPLPWWTQTLYQFFNIHKIWWEN